MTRKVGRLVFWVFVMYGAFFFAIAACELVRVASWLDYDVARKGGIVQVVSGWFGDAELAGLFAVHLHKALFLLPAFAILGVVAMAVGPKLSYAKYWAGALILAFTLRDHLQVSAGARIGEEMYGTSMDMRPWFAMIWAQAGVNVLACLAGFLLTKWWVAVRRRYLYREPNRSEGEC